MKNHWEEIYGNKPLQEMSWHQPVPDTSLSFFQFLRISKNASIIDVGGGDGLLVDYLLASGYTDMTVLDISGKALERAKVRLGDKSNQITWIESDILLFKTEKKFDVWHDRACFHFLTEPADIKKYLEIATRFISPNGYLILSAFSLEGPKKCSGLDVKPYDQLQMAELWKKDFNLVHHLYVNHETPFHTTQHFLFCGFQKQG